MARSARRVKPGVYACDDGSIINHDYEDGAVELAHKMLKTIKESTPTKSSSKEEL